MPATWSRKRVLIKKIVLNSRLNRGDAIRAGHNALGACDMVHNMNFIVWTSYGCDMESILWTSICNMDHRNWLPEIGQGTGELHNASEATFIADLAVPYWYRRSYGKRNKKRKKFFHMLSNWNWTADSRAPWSCKRIWFCLLSLSFGWIAFYSSSTIFYCADSTEIAQCLRHCRTCTKVRRQNSTKFSLLSPFAALSSLSPRDHNPMNYCD